MTTNRRLSVLLVAALASACASTVPRTQFPAPPDVDQVAQVAVLSVEVTPASAVVTVARVGAPPRVRPARADGFVVEEFVPGVYEVTAAAPGYITSEPRIVTMTAGARSTIQIDLAAVPVVGRRGPVRRQGHAYADDDGPWLSSGTTLFWALWGEKFAPEKLEQNLAFVAKPRFGQRPVDYIRVLSMVGAASWEERVIDPRWPDYWQIVDRLVARAARHGLRLQVTVFADAQVMMPGASDRDAWADAWSARVSRQPEMFTAIEAANEAWQNGFDDTADLARITKRINDRTQVLTAPSATGCGSHPEDPKTSEQRACVDEWRQLAAVSDLMTPHFDRNVGMADGYDRPIRQPWEMLFGPRELGVETYINNEPIGPQSSVASDGDPRRLAMAAATTWLTQGAAYTLHTGAGIRGGSAFDLLRGRSANIWEVPQIDQILDEIAKAKAALPANLPNCRPANAHWAEAPFSVDPNALTRAYQSVCDDGTFVVLPHGIRGGSVDLVARRAVVVDGVAIPSGGVLTVQGPSAIIVGKVR